MNMNQKIGKVCELVATLNSKGRNLGVNLFRMNMSVFDADNNCIAIKCGKYAGSIYFDFDDCQIEVDRMIRFLEKELNKIG